MNLSLRLRLITFTFIFITSFNSNAQKNSLVKYYDSLWIPTSKDSSFYYCEFKNQEELYLCQCFWKSSGTLRYIALQEDTFYFSKKIGLELNFFKNKNTSDSNLYDINSRQLKRYSYYENKQLKDSIFYDTESQKVDSAFHYYESGKLKAKYYFNKINQKETLNAFDSIGIVRQNIIYLKEANLKGDESKWANFIKKNINANIPVINNARPGVYTVIVRFNIQKNGAITDIKAETNHGYGMENEVIRLIKASPNWEPEIFLGETIVTTKRQPITFVVSN